MDVDRFVEQHLYALSGSFLFVIDLPGARLVYSDPCGSRSAVFDPQARLAGATGPLLLGPEAAARFDRELYEALDIVHDGWFPAGLTAHRGVERLLVNHYLDLDRWTQHRHWPSAPIPQAEPEAACRRVLDTTRRTVEALHATGAISVSLTAGNETRFMLAACRGIAPELDYVTAHGPAAALDVDRAHELASRFGLRHCVLPWRRATQAEAEDWQRRAGYCIGGGKMRNHPTVAPLEGRIFVAGFGGEMGAGVSVAALRHGRYRDRRGHPLCPASACPPIRGRARRRLSRPGCPVSTALIRSSSSTSRIWSSASAVGRSPSPM